MPGRVILIAEPSLALPGRWSVDYRHADRPEAIYQASILRFRPRAYAASVTRRSGAPAPASMGAA